MDVLVFIKFYSVRMSARFKPYFESLSLKSIVGACRKHFLEEKHSHTSCHPHGEF